MCSEQEDDGFIIRIWRSATGWHFEERAAKNNDLPTYEEAIGEGSDWQLLSESQSIFHDNGVGNAELKFINPDGREVVFDGDLLINMTDPRYMGTYNYINPAPIPGQWYDVIGWGAWVGKGIGHGVLDVAPYVIGGNVRGEN